VYFCELTAEFLVYDEDLAGGDGIREQLANDLVIHSGTGNQPAILR